MFKKKESLTVITPIPGFIPRQLAIDILHSHSEVITLNPLVLDHKPIQAPRDAQSDEFYSTWYEISERIQYIPGMGKMGSGTIKFNGCFHNMPWGLQTHIYAPMNVDLRNKYRIDGNQPGVEPPQQPEIGLKSLGAPADGLYLREDIEVKCNVALMSFVKSELQKAGKEMVTRIIKKAELIDAGVLHAMIEDGKLKTINPADRSNTAKSPLPSPTQQLFHPPGSPRPIPSPSPMTPSIPYQVPRPQSYMPAPNPYGQQAPLGYQGQQQQPYQAPEYAHQIQQQAPMELQGSEQHTIPSAAIEMPGDYYHPQPSPGLAPPSQQHAPPSPSRTPSNSNRDSAMSAASEPSRFSQNPRQSSPNPSQSGRWSSNDYHSQQTDSRPTSYQSDTSGGFRSPGLDHKGFATDLATHSETQEEHHRGETLKKLDPRIPQPSHFQQGQQQQQYNPQDYQKVTQQQQQYPYGYHNNAR